jgi:hypothetical protein
VRMAPPPPSGRTRSVKTVAYCTVIVPFIPRETCGTQW